MKLKLVVDRTTEMSSVMDLARKLEGLGHNVLPPAGIAGRQHQRHSLDGADTSHQDYGLIADADAVLVVNTSFNPPAQAAGTPNPCSPSILVS